MTLQSARLTILLLVAASLPAIAQDKNLAVVNGKPIPASNFESMIKVQAARGQADSPELRAHIKRQLINIELLSQEGMKLGLDKHADVKNELALARKEIIGRAMVADFVKKNPVKEPDIKAEYERYKLELTGVSEYRARHILLGREEEAKAIIENLKTGAKFETLAKQSKDAGSAANGGDLDWAPAGKYPKPFADALTALKKDQVTDTPIKTQLGYHVIKLEDIRPAKIGSFEEVKAKISVWLMQKKLQEFQQGLASKAKIQE